MLKGKDFLDYANLFSPIKNETKINDFKIMSITKKIKLKKSIVLILIGIEILKNPKISYIFVKSISSFYYLQSENEDEKNN